jgi:hypothetical protein
VGEPVRFSGLFIAFDQSDDNFPSAEKPIPSGWFKRPRWAGRGSCRAVNAIMNWNSAPFHGALKRAPRAARIPASTHRSSTERRRASALRKGELLPVGLFRSSKRYDSALPLKPHRTSTRRTGIGIRSSGTSVERDRTEYRALSKTPNVPSPVANKRGSM